jgi:hypothetical protein
VFGSLLTFWCTSFINQSYTWSRLQISEELFRKLVTRLRVHPSFLDIVHVFSEKVGPVEETYNHFFVNLSLQPSLQPLVGAESGSYGKNAIVLELWNPY